MHSLTHPCQVFNLVFSLHIPSYSNALHYKMLIKNTLKLSCHCPSQTSFYTREMEDFDFQEKFRKEGRFQHWSVCNLIRKPYNFVQSNFVHLPQQIITCTLTCHKTNSVRFFIYYDDQCVLAKTKTVFIFIHSRHQVLSALLESVVLRRIILQVLWREDKSSKINK